MINKEELVTLLEIIPRESTITLKRRFLGVAYLKTYKIRAFSFKDKIEMLHEYGEERFNKVASDPDDIEFEILHFKIIYNLISNGMGWFGTKDFKSFDHFLEHIIGFKKEVEILAAAMIARGVATSALLTKSELKDILSEVKKNKTDLTGATHSTNSEAPTAGH